MLLNKFFQAGLPIPNKNILQCKSQLGDCLETKDLAGAKESPPMPMLCYQRNKKLCLPEQHQMQCTQLLVPGGSCWPIPVLDQTSYYPSKIAEFASCSNTSTLRNLTPDPTGYLASNVLPLGNVYTSPRWNVLTIWSIV